MKHDRLNGHPAISDPMGRQQLYDLVWQEPMLRIGQRLGVSSSYLARVCTELRVPRPSRGYWAKLEFGKAAPAKPVLPPERPGDPTEWRRGDFLGSRERASKQAVAARPELEGRRPPEGLPSMQTSEPTHPLLQGIKQCFSKVRHDDGGYLSDGILRPYKRLMADVIASKNGLDHAVTSANCLYRALSAKGYRVTIAPGGQYLARSSVDVREVSKKLGYCRTPWAPERPTLVYIGRQPIGITIYEMTEEVEVVSRGSGQGFVPVRELTPTQLKRLKGPNHWTTRRDRPSGRLCLQAYCPSGGSTWVKRWPEQRPGQLSGMVAAIVTELTQIAPVLTTEIQAARVKAAKEQQERDERWRRQREAEALALQEKRRQQSREDLLKAIAAWDEVKRIDAYFAEVEQAAGQLDVERRHAVLAQLALARELIGKVDPLTSIMTWKGQK